VINIFCFFISLSSVHKACVSSALDHTRSENVVRKSATNLIIAKING